MEPIVFMSSMSNDFEILLYIQRPFITLVDTDCPKKYHTGSSVWFWTPEPSDKGDGIPAAASTGIIPLAIGRQREIFPYVE